MPPQVPAKRGARKHAFISKKANHAVRDDAIAIAWKLVRRHIFNRSVGRRMWCVCGVSSFQKRQTCNFLIKCYCKIDRRRKWAMIRAMRKQALADTTTATAATQQNNALTSRPTNTSDFCVKLFFPPSFSSAEEIAWCRHAANYYFIFVWMHLHLFIRNDVMITMR